jgi:hypothetical protein
MARKVKFRKTRTNVRKTRSNVRKSKTNVRKRITRKKTYKKRGGCNECVGSAYKSDGQWTSGPMKGGSVPQQNEDYSKYMLDSIPYSVA